jgi:hypothetical protein
MRYYAVRRGRRPYGSSGRRQLHHGEKPSPYQCESSHLILCATIGMCTVRFSPVRAKPCCVKGALVLPVLEVFIHYIPEWMAKWRVLLLTYIFIKFVHSVDLNSVKPLQRLARCNSFLSSNFQLNFRTSFPTNSHKPSNFFSAS